MKNYISDFLHTANAETLFQDLYGPQHIEAAKERYKKAAGKYENLFCPDSESGGCADYHIFSTPGRTEIGGNHTDHQRGRVLAGAVTLDALGVAAPTPDKRIRIVSEGFPDCFEVDLTNLSVQKEQYGTTEAVIRGMAAGFAAKGYSIGGFSAYVESRVLPGSGLSSSAAIEVLIGTILNGLYNKGEVPPVETAKIGHYAENNYFGKPSGLMDQTACACGGLVSIDLKNTDAPVIESVSLDLTEYGYSLLVADTRGSHADLTLHYATMPEEMGAVAGYFGKDVLREVDPEAFYCSLADIRKSRGDRAALRTLHFFQENQRVADQVAAVLAGDFQLFLTLVNQSGASSWKYLQNIFVPEDPREQEIALALGLTESFIQDLGEGACRVHGGGFAGTILVFLPGQAAADYTARMEEVFGQGAVTKLGFRSTPACMVM